MPKQILIVDDLTTNRRILGRMLAEDYRILEAVSGEDALDILAHEGEAIAAVLLDISMPGMDGYEVLQTVRTDARLSSLPVIMVTGNEDEQTRIKSLALGANDFVMKPYSPEIIKHCLQNNIALREASETLDALQRDRLTGLYNREAFFGKAQKLVAEHEPGRYTMACFDISKFKIINDQYGTQKGDEVLRHVGATFDEGFGPQGGVCGRIFADNFAVLYPTSFQSSAELAEIRRKATHVEGLTMPVAFGIGRYVVNDVSLLPSVMYDRAALAAETVKGRYDTKVAVYDESMRERLIREQEIVLEMEDALEAQQFEVWFQPQYNHSTHAMIGAEALVRWRHPHKGLIPPADFIPVFEQNGFIYSLDQFVWEESCRRLRAWLDEGRDPLPLSVNISRYDILRPEVTETIAALVKRYGLPQDLLRLEITESAFSESPQDIVAAVKRLIDDGFTVEIDDFGSGYSSLNTLKDVPAQIIKLDMKFLESSEDSERGGNIVESIVRMAKWLGMSVIAEGVETRAQADYLRSIGCSYMQGFLYAKPMPAAQYEEHCANSSKEPKLLGLETVDNLDNNAFWDPASMDTLIFNSYVGGACIYEYHNGTIELLRATEKYIQVIGSASMTIDDALKLNWAEHLDEANGRQVIADLEESIATRDDVTGDYVFIDLPGCPHETHLRSTMRVIASAGDRYLVYCTNENITERVKADEHVRRLSQQMQAIMDNVDLGIIVAVLENGAARYLIINNYYYKMLGYTKEQFEAEITSPYDTVAAEDRQAVMDETARINVSGESTLLLYNAITRDGRRRKFRAVVSMGRLTGIEGPVQMSILRDITEEVDTEQREREALQQIKVMMDDMPGALVRMHVEADGHVKPVYFNEGFCRLVAMSTEQIRELYLPQILDGVHPDDTAGVKEAVAQVIASGEARIPRYRLRSGNGGYIWVSVFGRLTTDASGEAFLNFYYTDAGEQVKEEELLAQLLSAMMDSTTDLSFTKDTELRYVTASRPFANMVGYANGDALVGKTDYDLFERDLAEKYIRDDRALLASGSSLIDMVEAIPSDDGTPHYSSTSKYLLRDGTGELIGLYGVGRDITHAVATDSQLRLVNNSIPGGLATYVCTKGGFTAEHISLSYFNDGFCKLFNFTREEYGAQASIDPTSMIFAEDRCIIEAQWTALMEKDTPIDCLYRAHVKDGGYKWISHKAVMTNRTGDTVVINAILQDVTDQRELIEQLRISEEENTLAVQLGGSIVCRYIIAEKSLTLSAEAAAHFGLPERIYNVPEEPVRLGMIAPESADAYTGFFESILRGSKATTATFQQKYLDTWRWMEAKGTTVFSDDGTPVKAVISLFDVTEQLERETIYKKWHQSLEDRPAKSYTLFRCNLNNDAAYATMEGALLGFDFDAAGANFNERARAYTKQCVFEEDRDRYTAFVNADTMLANYYRGKRSDVLEYRELVPSKDVRWLRLTIDMVEYPNSTEIEAYLMYENIDEAKQAELQTKELSETDPLTGVLNRTTFARRLEQIVRTSKPQTRHALLMLDIDGFKQVNDAFGHAAGDQALVDIAEGLGAMMRHGDLVARLGGDEFLIFLNDILDENSATAKARQICALARKSFSMEVQISGSVGIVIAPRDGMDFETLYKKADSALYYVKGLGKDNCAFYQDDMADEHLRLEPEAAAAPGTRKAERKRRMLIVDDNVIDHALLQSIFKDEFIIERAKDGSSALIRLRHYGSAISVVLLDLIMPGMDGFAVLEKMQENEDLRNIPVVIVSGDESREACLRAIRDGATDFITKPVDIDLLRIRVRSAVSKAENERLRAKNCLLEVQNDERIRYESALEDTGVTFCEYNWHTGDFTYYPSVSRYLQGTYDKRPLWQVLLSDMVADTRTVQEMQQLVHRVAESRDSASTSMVARLKTPTGLVHNFRVSVRKLVNEYQLTNKLIITFCDLDYTGMDGA